MRSASIRARSVAPISSLASWRRSKRQGTTRDCSARNRSCMTIRRECTTRGSRWLPWLRSVTQPVRRSPPPTRGCATSNVPTAAGPATNRHTTRATDHRLITKGPTRTRRHLPSTGSPPRATSAARPKATPRVSRPRPGQRRRLGIRAEFGQRSGVDRPRLDGARRPGHPRPGRLADAAAVRPECEPGFGVGVLSAGLG